MTDVWTVIIQQRGKKETERSPLHCISDWRRVKKDLFLTVVTYRTDVNHSWAPEGKTNNRNVRFPVTWGCFLTNNSSSILLVLRCRSASNFSLTYHCLNVQAMIKMIRIGIWVLILGGSVAERLVRWTYNPKTLGSIPALTAGWICSNPQPRL